VCNHNFFVAGSPIYLNFVGIFQVLFCPSNMLKLQLRLTVSQSVSQSVCLSVLVLGSHLEPMTRFFSDNCRFLDVGRLLRREDGSVIYPCSCLWALPEQPLLGPSPRELMTIFCSHLRLPQLGGPGPHIYIPQEQGGPVIPPVTGFPSRSLLRLAGLRWRYSNPPHLYLYMKPRQWAISITRTVCNALIRL
jgi:hypothetical protein